MQYFVIVFILLFANKMIVLVLQMFRNTMGNTPPVRSKFTDKKENEKIKYAASTCQGRNGKMEDAFVAILDLDDTNSTSFFGVYDGYGGAEVALYCAKQFHIELCDHEDYHNNLTNAVERVFFSLDEKLQQSDDFRELVTPRDNQWLHCLKAVVCAKLWTFPQATDTGPGYLGCTACVVVVRGNKIIVGNVGDSRCILSRNGQAIDLVPDHQLEIQSEIRTILTVGGGSEEQISIRNPDILTVDITDDVEFLVIASRGLRRSDMSNEDVISFVRGRLLFEAMGKGLCAICEDLNGKRFHMSSEEVADFVRRRLPSEKTQDLCAACEDLIEKGLPSGENTTVILVMFKAGDPVASASASASAVVEADNNINDEIDVATFLNIDDTPSNVFLSASTSNQAEADNNTGDEVDLTISASDRVEDEDNTSYKVYPTTTSVDASDRAKQNDNIGYKVDLAPTNAGASDTAEDDNNTSYEIDSIASDRAEVDNTTDEEVNASFVFV
ncbi:hypothetical protein GUJ93_ZPchr0006g45326 [Zizania palustris]|uniref:PPM-type phosphatase domain-containing protein n=1 Tax=Zizania palustris TaxID=103762 RepID=A0A8J5SKR9_ZIZPA|nr:hypothetical protein GUJ93_ZPchr0006g45326 [Zizania palustris]